MFLLDTNVISALMLTPPDRRVATWTDRLPIARLFTTSLSQAEILAGLASMPQGRRRLHLEAAASRMFADVFSGRILPFDSEAATTYARLIASYRRAGRAVATIDLLISSIALVHGATLVTRNVADFTGCGVTVVNPWDV